MPEGDQEHGHSAKALDVVPMPERPTVTGVPWSPDRRSRGLLLDVVDRHGALSLLCRLYLALST